MGRTTPTTDTSHIRAQDTKYFSTSRLLSRTVLHSTRTLHHNRLPQSHTQAPLMFVCHIIRTVEVSTLHRMLSEHRFITSYDQGHSQTFRVGEGGRRRVFSPFTFFLANFSPISLPRSGLSNPAEIAVSLLSGAGPIFAATIPEST